MPDWWTYRFSDFALFSERTYHRLFELHNAASWPAQLVALALGAGLLLPAVRRRGRPACALLAAVWAWVAISFHLQRYAAIHWGAPWFAALFGLEAGLFLWLGVVRARLTFDPAWPAGLGVYFFALLAQPLIGPLLLGRSWRGVELFGVAPDPTAVGTLALLTFGIGKRRWPLMILPVVWCLVTGATLRSIGAADFWVTPLVAVVAVALALRRAAR